MYKMRRPLIDWQHPATREIEGERRSGLRLGVYTLAISLSIGIIGWLVVAVMRKNDPNTYWGASFKYAIMLILAGYDEMPGRISLTKGGYEKCQ